MATKCPKCHSKNPEGTRFCGNCAIPLMMADLPIQEIREPLGHASLYSTLAYAKLAERERLEMNNKMNRVFDSKRGQR